MSGTGWKRLLVVNKEAERVAALVRAGAPELEVVARTADDVRAEDARRADMLLTFLVPDAIAREVGGIRWVQSVGAGVDAILGCSGFPKDVLITRVLDVFGPKMAEYVLARCLAIAQEMPALEEDRRARRWRRFFVRALREMTAVIVGAGEIGGAIGRRLAANGMRVIGVRRSGAPVEGFAEVFPAARLTDALTQGDVVVLVVPHAQGTRKLIGARELAAMKPGAWLINVARGVIVDEAALLDALRGGRIGGAALDVFETEPLPDDSPFWTLPNVLFSPHVSGLTTADEAANAFLDNWRRLERGEPPRGRVDRARGY
jgi:glyoxylate/hydroxypyruvate reductase A